MNSVAKEACDNNSYDQEARHMGTSTCPNLKLNLRECTCSYDPCSRKGRCCECISHHRKSGELPGCFFQPEVERTYDRSLRKFISTFRNT